MDLQTALASVPLRTMPWRAVAADGSIDPYAVMVSEIMLQQTQVARVIPKFTAFMKNFPNVQSLAEAPLSQVLQLWSGLGYNRRAKFLHQAAQAIVTDYAGQFPHSITELTKLPGVGKNTAGAIIVYAYNQPAIFVETNIRTVYIHHFFHDQQAVPDSAIIAKLEETLDKAQPREFYWRLMDYGTQLKKKQGNTARRSKTYTKQSAFAGSRRQLRGQVLRTLADGHQTEQSLRKIIADERLSSVLESLQIEGLITKKKQQYQLG